VPLAIPTEPDLGRMQVDRSARLQAVMGEQGIDAMVLLGNSNVSYATGARWPLSDPGRANVERPVAVVVAGDDRPHLFTPFEEPALHLPLSEDHLHGPVYVEFDEGAEVFARTVANLLPNGRRLAFDELPGAMRRAYEWLSPDGPPASADDVIGVAKLTKTADELGFLRNALKITEQAIAPVQAALAPGMRQTELTACFLHAAFEFGADANILDPIWQVMPARLADGPWTTHGDIACPLLTTERELGHGDVLWVDTGISYGGFASDFGRTWVVGREPTAREQKQFRAWREIMEAVMGATRSGATGADLTRAALSVSDGRRPWMPHFYLGHGLGIESAEPPFIGTDLGDAYDERQVLTTGTVVVLEPLVWDEGAAGYRAEEVIVVTDEGWLSLTDYPYDPYAD
jgi:Xaa-Pro aminopeptidase